MRKPGTDESNVQMSDVLCDFCHAEWTAERPMVEGHRGAVICGPCLAVAYAAAVHGEGEPVASDYTCVLCLEGDDDRDALDRADEAGWRSPDHPEIAICRRCVRLGAGVLHKDPEIDWERPAKA